jgi:hypothetical protein
VSPFRLSYGLSLAFLVLVADGPARAQDVGLGSVTTTLYARTDSNATTVWSPRTQVVGRPLEDLTLQASCAVDAWTSASVDIVTAATRAVHEVRQEINAGSSYTLAALQK